MLQLFRNTPISYVSYFSNLFNPSGRRHEPFGRVRTKERARIVPAKGRAQITQTKERIVRTREHERETVQQCRGAYTYTCNEKYEKY